MTRTAARPGGRLGLTAGLLLAVAWTTWWAWRSWAVSGLSWHFFADGGRLLVGGPGVHVYAAHPELQTGPLALLLAAALRGLPPAAALHTAQVVMLAAGPLLVLALAPVVAEPRRGLRLLLGVLVLVPAWTVLTVRWSHLDDVLAMACAVGAVLAVATRRPVLTGLALAGAMAAKPWAVGFVPLVVALPRARVRALLVAVLGAAVAWLPFVLGDRGTLAALHPPVALVPGSGLHTLGVRGRLVPAWGRTLQLVVAPAAALVAALLGRWPGVLLVAVAVRLTLDPQDNAYYAGSAALAAVVFDLLGTRWTVPWTTLVTVVALWQPFVLDYPHRLTTTNGLTHWWFAHPAQVGALHLLWAAAVVAIVMLAPRRAA